MCARHKSKDYQCIYYWKTKQKLTILKQFCSNKMRTTHIYSPPVQRTGKNWYNFFEISLCEILNNGKISYSYFFYIQKIETTVIAIRN